MSAPNPPDAATRLSRTLALASVGALIVLGLGWELLWARTGNGTLAVKVLPLVFVLPGLWRFRMRTYRTLSLLVWLYVAEGLVRSTSGEPMPGPALAVAELLLALVAFGACVLQVRWRLRKAPAT
jgi:uncharacterized membrane protein